MNDLDNKDILDGASVVVMFGYFTSVLPTIATLFTVIWIGIRIYESATVQAWVNRKAIKAAKAIEYKAREVKDKLREHGDNK